MRNTFYILSLAGLVGLHACKFKGDINTDPNNPQVVNEPTTLLTSSEIGFAYTYGGAYARNTSLFTNQLSGADRQMLSVDNFNFLSSETDDAWDNSYRVLRNLDAVIAKSTGSPHYSGVAKIMKAFILGTLADNFGAVPYRTALQATEDGGGLQPKYDDGADNYRAVHELLDQGIAEVAATESIISPADNDDVFGGDLDKWTQFAQALKARNYLHTAKKNPSDYDAALTAALAAQGIQAGIKFAGASVGDQNPLFQFQDQRGDLTSGRLLTDTINAFLDPRGPVYFVDSRPDRGAYVPSISDTTNGSNPGAQDGSLDQKYGFIVNPNVNPDDEVYFVNLPEPYFIAAEIYFRQGKMGMAADYTNQGVKASLRERGVSLDTLVTVNDDSASTAGKRFIATFLQRFANYTGDSTFTLNDIMVQKWLALYLQPEAWVDQRRTGIPVVTLPAANVTGGQFVRKFPYPQKERTLNAANVPQEPNPPALGKVWWDVP